jgi:hypothetical protein
MPTPNRVGTAADAVTGALSTLTVLHLCQPEPQNHERGVVTDLTLARNRFGSGSNALRPVMYGHLGQDCSHPTAAAIVN